MTVAFVADVHVGNFAKYGGAVKAGVNERATLILKALATAVDRAADADAFVVLGDLFHYANPEPQLIAAVQNILSEHKRPIVIAGNHDVVSSAYGDNALAPLTPVAQVLESPTCVNLSSCQLWVVPFRSGPASKWIQDGVLAISKAAAKRDGVPTILCIHAGVSDSKTPYYLDNSSGSISARSLAEICRKFGIGFVFAGDWHRHQKWKFNGVEVMQVGALCPNRFPPDYEDGGRGPMAVWSENKTIVSDIPGPRFFKRKWTVDGIDWPPVGIDGCSCYVKITAKRKHLSEAREWAEKHKDLFSGVEFSIDQGEELIKAKQASFEARQASSLDEAIQLYVKKMPLENGSDRDQILKKVRKYLA